MLVLFVLMFLILVMAGMVAVYVAYPYRRKSVPGAPWLGAAMRRGVAALPTIANQEANPAGAARPVESAQPAESGTAQTPGHRRRLWR